jgi:magnesium chelatase subunit D
VPRALHLEPHDLRQKLRLDPAGSAVLFAVDASGSMAARQRMAAVKGAILALLLDAYRRRDQVALIGFRGVGAELLLPFTASVDLAEPHLRSLPTGGRTPLAHGLALAAATLRRHLQARPGARPLLVLVTDGRANVPLGDGDPLEDARRQALLLAAERCPCLVVDTERPGPTALGLAAELAELLGARHLRLDQLSPEALAAAVRVLP